MKILYGITGSVAAKLAGKIIYALHEVGHEVRVIRTESSKQFVFDQSPSQRDHNKFAKVFFDDDEWVAAHEERVLHIELRDWADLLLIAPLTANTLAKLAGGFADNLLTSTARAWPRFNKRVVVAPAMNTGMWEHPLTAIQLRTLSAFWPVTVVPPQAKELYCGEIGMGALADIDTIIKTL